MRRRMHNSGLATSALGSTEEVVRLHGAIQGQDYGPTRWAIRQRAGGIAEADVDASLARGSIVRTHVLRPTWHLVAREDVRWLLSLTGPRVQRGLASRFRELGLDARLLQRCERAIVAELEGGRERTRAEIAAALDDAGIDRTGQRLPFMVMHCELEQVICSGGLRGNQQTYALMENRIPPAARFDRDEAVVELIDRYLSSHGPASLTDLRWWSSLTSSDLRRGLSDLGARVRAQRVDDVELWSMADEEGPTAVRGTRLLHWYDELIVGYTQSRFLGDPRAEQVRDSWRDRTRPRGVIVSGGRVTGHWRRSIDARSVHVEARVYEEPTRGESRALKAEAEELAGFLGKDMTLEVTRL